MTDDLHAPTTAGPPPPPPAAGDGPGPPPGDEGGVGAKASQVADQAQQIAADRPEVLVGAAFAGGFVAAMILKRLGR
ncbi:MAG TPA: hypothetical protein VN751_13390 [Solirubrobacteraceae bacterium]|nr:hypothetical protein [Solirubrobacteraceae bacterium]